MQTLTLKKKVGPDARVEFSRIWSNRLTPEQSHAILMMMEDIRQVGDIKLLVRTHNGVNRIIDIPLKNL